MAKHRWNSDLDLPPSKKRDRYGRNLAELALMKGAIAFYDYEPGVRGYEFEDAGRAENFSLAVKSFGYPSVNPHNPLIVIVTGLRKVR